LQIVIMAGKKYARRRKAGCPPRKILPAAANSAERLD
jgi:hypothetical protein